MVEGERTLCPFRYPGQYEDAETGLYYNHFRYFDPEAGGYISQDPIRNLSGSRVNLDGKRWPKRTKKCMGMWSDL
jgi:RHS repeat-associated protein